jgi:SAM-dependent methyltransferase
VKQAENEVLEACPVCGSTDFSLKWEATDHLVSRETFKIQECHACGLLFTSPRPGPGHIARYYQSDDYISHHDEARGFINRLYRLARKITLRRKATLVEKAVPGGKALLDYGCGTGDFLAVARASGYEVNGIEADANARKSALEKHGIEVSPPEDLERLPLGHFDVITLWHVLEHVHRLPETLEAFRKLLKPGGALIIAVPNAASADAAWYGKDWAAWDVPRHLYHFSDGPLLRLVTGHRFRQIATRPMYLDGFYIALLSEKHRNRGGWMARALWAGSVTFLKALFKPAKASSRIYICKK